MLNKKGQNVAEYSILIALVVGAAIAMQTYVKRGLQGRVKDAVDFTGTDTGDLTFSGNQYEPYYVDSDADVTSNRDLKENVAQEGAISRTGLDETSKKLSGSYETATAPQND